MTLEPPLETVVGLLEAGQEGAVALAAPNRPELTYGELRRQVDETVGALNGCGIGRGDVVAIVLANGPEMASAFVAIAAGATTAPLNPAYREEELEFYLTDLDAKLLVVEEGSETPAREVAGRLGIAVTELVSSAQAPAGRFSLRGQSLEGQSLEDQAGSSSAARPGYAQEDDIALVLHTSGTTSRPKLVPLSQRNVCSSALSVRDSLSLVEADRCLNIMPLFHIHGLMAAVLGSLSAGASVFCTPGFNALKFFAWMADARPTWYTAVPTMHQAILARSDRNRATIDSVPLRFLRSSSASLPPRVMADLEATFGAPVIEAYGMTEAAHQMASNPLPPAERKAGAVGPAAGPEIAIMDDAGRLLSKGAVGEVVIRGPNVTRGYLGNPEANASAFTDGWFRTGDQGVLDDDHYLRLTGRLKEIINRGGEKISPREVDEILLDHPAVAQAVTFALPHDKLGEEVAAAIVLEEGTEVAGRELRDFVRRRLADFKVPRKVIFVDEIPKGPTGKLQRIGLADKLGVG